ncbi:putative gustatory receptor 28b isoform X2 [Thrips palmi]|uniref:Gustatory receptor n=1 Tax=Thrips palmi TaxID=161013 RepID=A0A6P8Z3I8_THRPL|nr:putative gustatory receptor 28b isoform X2 [Thrips palmi]
MRWTSHYEQATLCGQGSPRSEPGQLACEPSWPPPPAMDIVQRKVTFSGLWRLGRSFGLVPVAFGWCRCLAGSGRARGKTNGIVDVSDEKPPRPPCRCRVDDAVLPSRCWLAYSVGQLVVMLPRDEVHPTDSAFSAVCSTADSVTWAVAITMACLTRHRVLDFVRQLHEVDRLLRRRSARVPSVLLWWLAALVLLAFLDMVFVALFTNAIVFAINLPNLFNNLGIYVLEALFTHDAYSVLVRFRTLNARLRALDDDARHQAQGVLCPTRATSTFWVMTVEELVEERGEDWADTLHTQLKRLSDAHSLLCESTHKLTHRFGPVLLVDTLNLLLHLVLKSNYFFSALASSAQTFFIPMQACWLLAHLGRVLLLVWPCSKAKQEAQQTGALVGTLMNHVPPKGVERKQLEVFTCQLLHHQVTFSACGLFELDFPLVASVLTAVTTYLVVVLQLKETKSCPPTIVPETSHEIPELDFGVINDSNETDLFYIGMH